MDKAIEISGHLKSELESFKNVCFFDDEQSTEMVLFLNDKPEEVYEIKGEKWGCLASTHKFGDMESGFYTYRKAKKE